MNKLSKIVTSCLILGALTGTAMAGPGWTQDDPYVEVVDRYQWDYNDREQFRMLVEEESARYDEIFAPYETRMYSVLTPRQQQIYRNRISSPDRYAVIYMDEDDQSDYESFLVSELELTSAQEGRMIPIFRDAVTQSRTVAQDYETRQLQVVERRDLDTFHTDVAEVEMERDVELTAAPEQQTWTRDYDMK